MKMLRDYFIIALIICLILGGLFVFAVYVDGQEEQTPAHKSWYDFRNTEFIGRLNPKPPPYESWYDSLAMTQAKEDAAKAEEPALVKTWKIPDYMRENLQHELDDFNKRFDNKVQAYKKELKTRFAEFKDMPDDAILYLEGGFFITRSDFLKLQEELRDKLKKEVKGDDKTTN